MRHSPRGFSFVLYAISLFLEETKKTPILDVPQKTIKGRSSAIVHCQALHISSMLYRSISRASSSLGLNVTQDLRRAQGQVVTAQIMM